MKASEMMRQKTTKNMFGPNETIKVRKFLINKCQVVIIKFNRDVNSELYYLLILKLLNYCYVVIYILTC